MLHSIVHSILHRKSDINMYILIRYKFMHSVIYYIRYNI